MGAATVAAVVGAGASVFGAISGERSAAEGRRAQERALQDAKAAFANIAIPEIDDQMIELLAPELVGEYTPEEIQSMLLQDSLMKDVQADPEAVAAQKETADMFKELAEGGYTEADKALMRQVHRETGQMGKARRDAILSEMAQRGVLGSGMELAAQLKGEQDVANVASQESDRAIQQAQARAMQAAAQRGTLASQMRGQSFGEQAQSAQAQDAINKFNIANQQNVLSQNVGARNQAQLMNLQNKQALENQRAQLANQQQMYNKQLQQQKYENELARAQGISGAQTAQAQAAATQSQAGATMGAGMVGAGADLLGAFAGGGS